jgi:hypothetical protein
MHRKCEMRAGVEAAVKAGHCGVEICGQPNQMKDKLHVPYAHVRQQCSQVYEEQLC